MSATKHFLENLSVQIGFGGEINDEVLHHAQTYIDREVSFCVGCEENFTGEGDYCISCQDILNGY